MSMKSACIAEYDGHQNTTQAQAAYLMPLSVFKYTLRRSSADLWRKLVDDR
jgi:hypothetical protein